MQDIICFRIDDRLIHGQVAAMWTRYLKQTRIVVIDDEANKSELQKHMLRMACPSGIKLSVLTVEKAVRNFDEKKYYGDKILAIVKSPKTIVELINANFGKYMPNEIVVGNMSGSKEKKQIAPGFNVDEYDVDLFKKINEYGFVCYYQLLPSNNKEEVVNML